MFIAEFQSNQPIAHSTPKIVPLQKRRGIRETKTSLIKDLNSDNENEFNSDNDLSGSEPESNTEDSSKCIRNEIVENDKQDQSSKKTKLLVICFIISLIIAIFKLNEPRTQVNIEDLTKKYGLQEEDFWMSFQILISDSIKYNQPKCLVLMYNESTAATLELLLSDLSKYATCKLTSCTSNPIIIEAHELQRKNAPNDYGEIIRKNKNDLIESGVMVVKNVETVSSQSAMAFQSLCDEYQPVVSKAIILFTLKIDEHPQDKNMYVEYILREKWSDLTEDSFFPLLARISNFIFLVQANK